LQFLQRAPPNGTWAFLPFFLTAFTDLSSLVLDRVVPVSITPPPRHNAPTFSSVTSLSIQHKLQFRSANETALLLGLLPNVNNFRLGGHSHTFDPCRTLKDAPLSAKPSRSLQAALQALAMVSEGEQPIQYCPSLKHLIIEHTYLNPPVFALLTACLVIEGRIAQRFRVSLKKCRYTAGSFPDGLAGLDHCFSLLEATEMGLFELGDLAQTLVQP